MGNYKLKLKTNEKNTKNESNANKKNVNSTKA